LIGHSCLTYWPLERLVGSFCCDFLIYFGVLGSETLSNPLRAAISCRAAQSLLQTDGYVSENTPVSWFSNGHAMPWPCHGHAMAMAWPWRGYAPANPPETSVLEKVTCTIQQK